MKMSHFRLFFVARCQQSITIKPMAAVLSPVESYIPFMRSDGREFDQLRPIRFNNGIAPNATGSTLVEWGNTRVICAVTIEESVPRWMKEQNVTGGWVTAEYS